jgi:SAM-dependent methyltransferase
MRGIEHVPWLYDVTMRVLDALVLTRLRLKLVTGVEGRVLEVGCGTGRNLPYYPSDTRLIALEPDAGTLARARRRSRSAEFVIGSVESMPFHPASFDTVVSSLVFCSVGDPTRGLREIRLVLRDGGRLRMLEHVRDRRRFWAALQDRVQPLWTWLTGGCRPNRDTEAIVKLAGFCIESSGREATHILRLFSARPAAEPGSRQRIGNSKP